MNWLLLWLVLSLVGGACYQRGLQKESTKAPDQSNLGQFSNASPSDSSSIWLVTLSGELIHLSKNGEARKSDIDGEIVVVNFLDSRLGWVVDRNNRTWKTLDGGNSWELATKSSLDLPDFYLPQQLLFVDNLHGWLVGLFKIWRTVDGGENWQEQFSVSKTSEERVGRLYRGAFIGVDSAWVTSSGGVLLRTDDGGKTWKTFRAASEHTDLHDIFLASQRSAWLVGRPNGGVYHTNDGGKSWQSQLTDDNRTYINSLNFVDERNGWAAGWRFSVSESRRFAVVMHTSDSGHTWLPKETQNVESFFDRVTFFDEDHGWLLAQNDVYYTDNAGESWRSIFRLAPMRGSQGIK